MTWSLTLAGLPRVGAKSKPHDYKQKIQKMKDLPKTWVSCKNHLKILDQKNQKFQSCHGEQNKGNTRPQMQKLNMDHVTRKKKTEANLKKKALIKIVGTLKD